MLKELYQKWESKSLKFGSNLELIQAFDRRNLTHKYAELLKKWFKELE